MKNRYSHLEEIVQVEYNWRTSMFKKCLPERAFYNNLTANILVSMQTILVKGFVTADYIKSYFKF